MTGRYATAASAQAFSWLAIAAITLVCGRLVASLSPAPLSGWRATPPTVRSVLLLLICMVCYAPAAVIAEYLIVQRGVPPRAASVAGVSLVFSSLLEGWVAPRWAGRGVSVASSISYAAMLVLAVLGVSKQGYTRFRGLLPGPADVRDVVGAAVRTARLEPSRADGGRRH